MLKFSGDYLVLFFGSSPHGKDDAAKLKIKLDCLALLIAFFPVEESPSTKKWEKKERENVKFKLINLNNNDFLLFPIIPRRAEEPTESERLERNIGNLQERWLTRSSTSRRLYHERNQVMSGTCFMVLGERLGGLLQLRYKLAFSLSVRIETGNGNWSRLLWMVFTVTA
ncbi:unnamed protein product [Mytilus coruscus]|uniref:Uncharacterized protein n=1 Tax=Mytilus coruscus TaxID=42192 RepID=A0A6J8AL74_MYTCO|nr:unnamed protein product [Mytilus coruscus]